MTKLLWFLHVRQRRGDGDGDGDGERGRAHVLLLTHHSVLQFLLD